MLKTCSGLEVRGRLNDTSWHYFKLEANVKHSGQAIQSGSELSLVEMTWQSTVNTFQENGDD